MRWAFFGDQTAKKIMINTRGTCYKPRDTETDTADRGHSKLAFHNAINKREFATNPRVAGKNNADCECSRFVFYGAINMRKQTKLACHGNQYCARRSPAQNAETRCKLARHGDRDCVRRLQTKTQETAANQLVTSTGTEDCTVDAILVEHCAIPTRIGA